MTYDQLKQRFPRASWDFLRQNSNLPDSHTGPVAKLEPNPSDGALGAVQVQEGTGRRFLVVVTAVRKRLIDEDNLCEKYHVDLCRYAGIIPCDGPATTSIQVRQQKAKAGEREETRIEVYEV